MTETQWLASKDPNAMLTFLRPKATERKLRLFACACCRRVRHLLSERALEALEASERFAEREGTWEELLHEPAARLAESAGQWWVLPSYSERPEQSLNSINHIVAPCLTVEAVTGLLEALCLAIKIDPHSLDSWLWSRIHRAHAALLRDVFPYPLRPAALDPTWLDPTVQNLVKAAHGDQDYAILPILADALEDAGCTDADILNHCRGPGPHVRGCWVIDLLLGKE